MSTIREVAKAAGVSVATVSRVINNNGPVKAETRKKVEQTIKSMNYEPNLVARSLFSKKSKMVGIIIPDIQNPFYAQIIEGIQKVLQANGYYSLVSFDAGGDKLKYQSYIKNFEQNNVAGIISSAFEITDPESVQVPLVMYDSANIDDEIVRVASDNLQGGKACADLIQGHPQHLVVQYYSTNFPTIRERVSAILEELNQRQLSYQLAALGDATTISAKKSAEDLVAQFPQADAFIAVNDIFAAELIQALKKAGRRIPEDVQVVGYDNNSISQYLSPALSTVDQQPRLIGQIAAKRLLAQIKGDDSAENSLIPVKKVKRDSTL